MKKVNDQYNTLRFVNLANNPLTALIPILLNGLFVILSYLNSTLFAFSK
jgi:hypothetical protein